MPEAKGPVGDGADDPRVERDGSGERPYYRRHVFCCVNERPEAHPRGSCSRRGSVRLRNYMKARAKELGLGDVRINASGCLDRCELGPTMVVYPEGVWYHYETRADIDEILQRHIIGGAPVERLRLHPDARDPGEHASPGRNTAERTPND